MNARAAYLETQVLTASPPRLRLLLIQAAMRTAQKSLERWAAPLPADVVHALALLRQVLTQLTSSLGHGQSKLQRDLAGVYLYLFRSVTQAQLSGDAQKLRDVLRVLEAERNTWQTLAERRQGAAPHEPSALAAGS